MTSQKTEVVAMPTNEDFQKIMSGTYDAGVMRNGQKIDPRNLIFQNRVKDESECSLWNDPRWSKARGNMSEDQYSQYQTIGSQFHGSIDYKTGENTGVPIPEPARDCLAHIILGLKSGLRPSELDPNEIKILETFKGSEWYKEFGYESFDA